VGKLCDGCGRCCLHKLREDDPAPGQPGRLHHTEVACRLLDCGTARCRDYNNRRRRVPDCIQLTPDMLGEIDWLPPSCAYRMLAEGRDLAPWHPLRSGDPHSVARAGRFRGRPLRGRARGGRAGGSRFHLARAGAAPGRAPAPHRIPHQRTAPMKDALFGGINAAVLTAMNADFSPNLDRMAAHAKWLLANGCNGLGVLGTTGEATSFSTAERKAILEGLVQRGVPAGAMMPGTGVSSLTETVELTLHARAQGCRGVLLLPPFYYKAPSDDGLFTYFDEVAKRVAQGGGGIALYLYNFPQQSAVPFSLSLIGRCSTRIRACSRA
jgi:uncharacterized cysteine cluster protein YcgN (CxxCxxCC family)